MDLVADLLPETIAKFTESNFTDKTDSPQLNLNSERATSQTGTSPQTNSQKAGTSVTDSGTDSNTITASNQGSVSNSKTSISKSRTGLKQSGLEKQQNHAQSISLVTQSSKNRGNDGPGHALRSSPGLTQGSSALNSLDGDSFKRESSEGNALSLASAGFASAGSASPKTQSVELSDPMGIWQSCLKLIRSELDSQIFSAWIRPLRLIEVRSKSLSANTVSENPPVGEQESTGHNFSVVVAATNKFALDHVQRHYSESIAAALATILSADSLSLSFRVEKPTPLQPSSLRNQRGSQAKEYQEGTSPNQRGNFSEERIPGNPYGSEIGRNSTESQPGDSRMVPLQHSFHPNGAPSEGTAFPGSAPGFRQASARSGSREETNLNPKYNFSNFVVGSCNQFAHAASLRVSEMPGCNYNPLFIYGGVGLGKTHLANAIGNSTRRQNKKALLVTSEAFVSELIAALRSNRMQQFKEKFRSLDLLIIDDIQFIIGKERTQEEFFHTFNDLYNRRKQIVITSDTVPQELAGVEERLRTRFACGLAVDLQAPDLETRVAILTKKAEAAGVFLEIDIARYIADAINTNVRELEGAFNRLQAMSSLQTGTHRETAEISLELAQEVVKDFRPRRQVEVTTELIQRMVAERYNVSITDLLGKRRTHNVALARQVAMYLCRKLTSYSYPEIGAYFGGRDHSTVIHSYRTVEERAGKDKELSEVLEVIQKAICG